MALEAKAAAALLKYVPLPAGLLPAAIAKLATGATADSWAARAAALVFAQVALWCQAFVFACICMQSCVPVQHAACDSSQGRILHVQHAAFEVLQGRIRRGLASGAFCFSLLLINGPCCYHRVYWKCPMPGP